MDPTAPEPAKRLSSYTPQTDSSKFIRTYAKDLAALGHAVDAMPAPRVPPPAQEKTTVTESGVMFPEYDSSPVNRPGPSVKEFPQEVVDLKESDSADIFKIPSGSSAPEPDREAVLARLRAKVSAQRSADSVTPPVSEPALRTAAPDFTASPEPVLPIPQVRKEPLPAPPILVSDTPSRLHTYSSDFSDRIDTAGGTTFSVLAAQSDAEQSSKPAPRKRTFVPLIAGGTMLIVGIGAIVGAYAFTRTGSIVPVASSVPSLIPFDEGVEVKGTGLSLMQAISAVGQGGTVQGNVVVTYVTLAASTGSGIPQPGGVLIKELGLSMPGILLRNIVDSSTVGIVRAGTESRPFMVLKVNSYERTFAGMLAWEPSMASDLATFYPAYDGAESTGTSTAKIPAHTSPSFTDGVVSNYDVRVLRDSSGRSLLLYGYRGKDTLVIARDEAAFTELVSRLSAARN